MAEQLLRLFIGHNTDSVHYRARVGRFSGTVGLVCNLLLFAAKLIIGILSGSVAITADAMNNLSDASSSIITLFGFKLAEKPADADHPYGHARYEYLSGLAVAILIIVIGVELAKSSVEKIIHPTPVTFSLPLVVVLLLSILVKLWLYLFNRALGRRIHSTTLLATAADSRNDVITTTVVLLCAIVEAFTPLQSDGYMGLGVALFILYSGAMLVKDTINPLLGEAASPELQQKIVDIVQSNPKILGYHDLMIHDYGPNQRFASLHVEMDQNETPMICHDIIDNLERQCLERHNIHLVIHYDPIVTGDTELIRMQEQVRDLLQGFDARLTIHDFRMVYRAGRTDLAFDVALPDDLSSKKDDIRSYLEKSLYQQTRKSFCIRITFDPTHLNAE